MDDLISRKETEKMLRKYADEVGCNRGLYDLANGILKAVSYLDNIPDAFTNAVDMTENEAKAVKWMKNVMDDAVVTLDHIKNNEPNVSPMLYEGRKEKAGTIIKAFKELEKYRSIGTVEGCREAMEKQRQKKPVKDGYGHDCCPECGWIVYTEEYGGRYLTHCENCGQAIDWSDNS